MTESLLQLGCGIRSISPCYRSAMRQACRLSTLCEILAVRVNGYCAWKRRHDRKRRPERGAFAQVDSGDSTALHQPRNVQDPAGHTAAHAHGHPARRALLLPAPHVLRRQAGRADVRHPIRRCFAGFEMESVDINYTVGGGQGVARREVIIYCWDGAAEPVGLF